MNNMTQIFDISEVENGLSLFKEDKPFSDEKKLKVYYISDMHLEHHFNYEISIQKQINKIVKDLFSDDFKSDLSMNNLVVLFNGDIADNAEFVSLFFNQFILRWNYVLYKRYKVNQSNILPDEEVKAYEKIRDQQIDRLNKIGKLYKKKNLCEKLLSLDISDLDKSIKKMKLPEYVINIIEKITKCDYKIRFINNYIIPYVEKREKFTFIKTKLPIFVTLGNHEISNFDTLSQAYNYYKSLYDSLGIKLLHNNSYENDDYIIFGGIGFAKYNERYNADSLCGPRLFSRKEEIKESDLFFKEYKNRLDNAINQKKKLIVVSHYPVRDWLLNYVTDLHCSYFTGHTHQNQNLLQKNIYADNQIGYYNNCFKMKSVNLGVASNPFFDYKDGYHVITTEDYAKFYNYSKERIQGTRLIENQIKNYGEKFYMIKHKGKYVFFLISHINTKICIGGKIKTISNCSDIEHFDKIFDKMVNKYIELFAPYWKYINQMASEVKSLGYCGDVHGCIVDLDFCNHIMINPLDQKVTFYNSPTMGFVKIFDNLENLITYMNNGYILDIEKKKMLELKNNNAIISKTSQEISQEVGELIKIDIKNSVYSISNYMRQIQRLFDSNILRDWNEDIISIQKKVSGT